MEETLFGLSELYFLSSFEGFQRFDRLLGLLLLLLLSTSSFELAMLVCEV
jgi:hypothetical protein